MAKNKSIILTVIVILFAAFYLTNCDNDTGTESKKGGNNNGNPVDSSMQELVGTWELTKITIQITPDSVISGPPSTFSAYGMPNQVFITLNEDSTNHVVMIYADSTDSADGTWSASGNTLTASLPVGENESVTGTYTLSEDKNTITYDTTVELFGFPIPVTLELQRRES